MFRKLAQKINPLIPWSSIASIGNSTPARLTILAPLVGYLVIYNQLIADFFFLSAGSSETSTRPPSLLDLLGDLKLTFLYFGLIFFGSGAILFAVFAPKTIRRYRSPEEYVLKMEAVQTEWLVIDNLTRVGKAAWKGEYFENPESYGNTSLSFTEETLYQLDAILEYAGENAFSGDETVGPDGEPDLDFGFYNALGNVMTDKVLECILSRRRADQAFWHKCIREVVEKRARETLYMAYTFDEWSRFGARLSSAAMFSIGGLLLAIPTIITSVQVLFQNFR